MSIRGIDVSDYQPNVNWQTVARGGILLSFIKSTASPRWISQTFARNWAGMKGAGFNAVLTTFGDRQAAFEAK